MSFISCMICSLAAIFTTMTEESSLWNVCEFTDTSKLQFDLGPMYSLWAAVSNYISLFLIPFFIIRYDQTSLVMDWVEIRILEVSRFEILCVVFIFNKNFFEPLYFSWNPKSSYLNTRPIINNKLDNILTYVGYCCQAL